ncbi:unnamed protein product [Schistosoma mattheei]|uniref:Uncharacterized protein n=1 Tax=Schistosoma mattheei TaxID=31246 RepID=A0AA85BB32_9TREM|nr:unnamed protein product [Schistosoma mattheei]
MIIFALFLLTTECIVSVPVIPTLDNTEEAAQYKKYLEEAPKAINVDPQTLASARKVFGENSSLDDLLLLWNTSLRDKHDETKRHLVEKLIKAHLKKAADSHPNTMGGIVYNSIPGYETESPKK